MNRDAFQRKIQLHILWGVLLPLMSCSGRQVSEVKIVLFVNGQQHQLSEPGDGLSPQADSTATAQVIGAVESLYADAQERLKQIVTNRMIDEVKRARALEVIYPGPQSLKTQVPGEIEKPVRLLIPLEGEWVGDEEDPSVVIFCGFPQYSAGPLWVSKGLEGLRTVIEHLNWERK